MNDVSVAILCGGKSSRMQSEKGLVLYNGIPFIEHIIAAAKELSSPRVAEAAAPAPPRYSP